MPPSCVRNWRVAAIGWQLPAQIAPCGRCNPLAFSDGVGTHGHDDFTRCSLGARHDKIGFFYNANRLEIRVVSSRPSQMEAGSSRRPTWRGAESRRPWFIRRQLLALVLDCYDRHHDAAAVFQQYFARITWLGKLRASIYGAWISAELNFVLIQAL